MKKIILFSCIFLFGTNSVWSQQNESSNERLLLFTKTDGFRHGSIPTGIEAIERLGAENGLTIIQTEDASLFNADDLQQFDAIIFLSTTGDILNNNQQSAFEAFIQDGGGFVGIHSATDTEYEWTWYGSLVGAYFDGHPQIQEATIEVLNSEHSSTDHLPEHWNVKDEWYNFRDIQPHINVLANLDESTYEGGENGVRHPIAWYHEFDGGRVFYTGRGHTDESFSEPMFMQHILGGIQYVTGQ